MWAVVADANRYFAGEEPWAKGKTDPARMGTILYVTAEVVRQVAILAQPATPAGAASCSTAGPGRRGAQLRTLGETGPAAAGHRSRPPTGAFPRYVEPEEEARRKAGAEAQGAEGEELKCGTAPARNHRCGLDFSVTRVPRFPP